MSQNDQHRAGRRTTAAMCFPLSKDILVEAAQPVATVAVAATCAALVFTQQQLDTNHPSLGLAMFMNCFIFFYIPVGLCFLLLSVAVRKHTALVGVTSVFILGHILLPSVIGGLLTVVKMEENPWGVVFLTTLKCVLTIVTWAILCTYPEFLHTGIRRLCGLGGAEASVPKLQIKVV